MSTTAIVTKYSPNRWTYKLNDREAFAIGRYNGFISESIFRVTSKSGALRASCPVSGVTIIDMTAGGASFNTANWLSLYAKLDAMLWPGMLNIEGGGGSGEGMTVLQRTFESNPIMVPTGFTVSFVVNQHDFLNPPTGTVAGTDFTITTNVPDEGAPLLIFGYTPAE